VGERAGERERVRDGGRGREREEKREGETEKAEESNPRTSARFFFCMRLYMNLWLNVQPVRFVKVVCSQLFHKLACALMKHRALAAVM
jgi:hypothetical protein